MGNAIWLFWDVPFEYFSIIVEEYFDTIPAI
jgi:hypothetical protein